MKFKNLLLAGLVIAFATASCTADVTTTGKTGESKTEEAAPKGITVAEAIEMEEGTEVTVHAYSWGAVERTDNTVQLDLGDKKAEGMVTLQLNARFPKEKLDELNKIEKNSMVTVKGKLGNSYGPILTDCEIIASK